VTKSPKFAPWIAVTAQDLVPLLSTARVDLGFNWRESKESKHFFFCRDHFAAEEAVFGVETKKADRVDCLDFVGPAGETRAKIPARMLNTPGALVLTV
jgi:hypothetical protein